MYIWRQWERNGPTVGDGVVAVDFLLHPFLYLSLFLYSCFFFNECEMREEKKKETHREEKKKREVVGRDEAHAQQPRTGSFSHSLTTRSCNKIKTYLNQIFIKKKKQPKQIETGRPVRHRPAGFKVTFV